MPNFEAERSVIAKQLLNRLMEIQASVYTQRQPIDGIEACVTGRDRGPEEPPAQGWKPFAVPSRWGGFDQTTWFRMRVAIPSEMKGCRVVALIRPRGESCVFLNGKRWQGLDDNRDFVLLTEKAKGNETFEIILESVPSTQFDLHREFEYADIAVMHSEPWDFYWDAHVAGDVYRELPANYTPRQRLFNLLDRCIKMVNLGSIGEPAYYDSLRKAQRALRQGLRDFEHSYGMGRLVLIGHSHIDSAWLWPIRETQRKITRTFGTVLRNMERYPEYHFSCSQAVQYDWVKTQFPDMYAQIKQRVKEGRWEPNGCFWVEPDLNVPSGESLVRQAVYGNRFFRKEFGIHSRVAWLPDTFGYCYGLPQILKKAQVDYFVTSKLHWNYFTKFPYTFFQWEGTDGSRVVAVRPWDYNGMIVPRSLIEQWNQHTQKEKADTFIFPYGWGDGGGGPTPEFIEAGKRLSNIVGVPKCEFGTVAGCIDDMVKECPPEQLPVWNGELYFELHRGCQTTQSRTKRGNRKCELMLRDTELLSTMAMLHGLAYPQDELYQLWKILLTNQFHDILPGTSITEVYRRTEKEHAEVLEKSAALRTRALEHLASCIDSSGEGAAILVFNTLSWPRQDRALVEMDLPEGEFMVVDALGDPVAWQRVDERTLLLETEEIPPLGYAVYHVVPGGSKQRMPAMLKVSEKGMENEFLRIRFDKGGQLTSVYDKAAERELLPKGEKGNVLQLFEDRPCDWDAWDVDFNIAEHMWTAGPAKSIEVIESGPVRGIVRMAFQTGKSAITQDITLCASSERMDFVTTVDWREKRTLLKAAFPLDLRSTRATYEVQFGTVERPTHRNRDSDFAQFEVPAQRWADLSEGDYGVSLLNDCKYGYDVKDNVMRLSLLRSPVDPDPHADEGMHHFTYSLFPHPWGWRNGTVAEALELNAPLIAMAAPGVEGKLPSSDSFADVLSDHVVLDTVKRCEDSKGVIVRLYEAHGQRGEVCVTFAREPKKITECDLMEENDRPVDLNGATLLFYVKPYELRTFKVVF